MVSIQFLSLFYKHFNHGIIIIMLQAHTHTHTRCTVSCACIRKQVHNIQILKGESLNGLSTDVANGKQMLNIPQSIKVLEKSLYSRH